MTFDEFILERNDPCRSPRLMYLITTRGIAARPMWPRRALGTCAPDPGDERARFRLEQHRRAAEADRLRRWLAPAHGDALVAFRLERHRKDAEADRMIRRLRGVAAI